VYFLVGIEIATRRLASPEAKQFAISATSIFETQDVVQSALMTGFRRSSTVQQGQKNARFERTAAYIDVQWL
jgi:hypothetical protein